MVEKLIQARHLKQFVRSIGEQREMAQDLAVQAPASSATPRVVINYIHRALIDERYSSKRKKKKLFRTTSIRERVSFIQHNFSKRSMQPTNDTVSFPLINASRVLQPHEDALLLTLGISGFDIRRVLVDPGSSADLLEMSTYMQMGYSPSTLDNPG